MPRSGPDRLAGRIISSFWTAALLTAPVAGVFATEPQLASSPEEVLSGVVVDRSTREPVAGALVRYGRRMMRKDGSSWFEGAITSTDPHGGFRTPLRTLRPDEWPLAPPYDYEEWTDLLLVQSPDHAMFWSRGYPRQNLSISLSPGASLSGTVEDSNGNRFAEAALLLSPTWAHGFQPTSSFFLGETKSDGSFSFPRWLWPSQASRPHILFAIAEEGIGWCPVELLKGDREPIENVKVRIESAPPLTVFVEDPEGLPIEEITVRAEPRFRPLGGGLRTNALSLGAREEVRRIFSTITDSNGRATLCRLPVAGNRTYNLVAETADRARWTWIEDVVLHKTEPTSVTLTLIPFRACSIRGRVTDETGYPIENAVVEFRQRNGSRVTTDRDGAFSIRPPHPGALHALLNVTASGFARVRKRVALSRNVDVEVKIVLAKAISISGRVVDPGGRPVEGVWVTPQGANLVYGFGESDAEGRFQIGGLPEGNWMLRAHGRTPSPSDTEIWGESELVAARGGQHDVQIVVPRIRRGSTTVSVILLDDRTGALCDPGRAELVRSGSSEPPERWAHPGKPIRNPGSLRFECVPPGRWTLWVASLGYAPTSMEFDVSPTDVEQDLEVRLRCSGRIVGTVLSETTSHPYSIFCEPVTKSDTIPIPLWLRSEAIVERGSSLENPGRFELQNIAPGIVRLWVEQPGCFGEVEVEVFSGQTTTVMIPVVKTALNRPSW